MRVRRVLTGWVVAGMLFSAGCAMTDGVSSFFDKHRRSGPDGGDDTMQQARDPVPPGEKSQHGIHYDPREWVEGQYHPETVQQRITSTGFKGITRVTFAEAGGDHNIDLNSRGDVMVYASTRYSVTPKLCLQRVNSKAVTLLTDDNMSDMMPKLSPDGQLIAWCSNRYGSWDILVKRDDESPESRPHQLTRSGDDDIHPTWSHDQRLLAFSRYNQMDGQWQIWVMDYNTRTLNYVTEGIFPEFRPVPGQGPGGQPVYTLAYQRHRKRDVPWYSIWTIDVAMGADGTIEAVNSPSEIIASDKWAAITPCWSPDGEYLAFATVRKSTLAKWQARLYRADDIWVVRLDGTDLTQITSHSAPDWDPDWANDPSNPLGRIFFTSTRNGIPNVYSVRPLIPGYIARGPEGGR